MEYKSPPDVTKVMRGAVAVASYSEHRGSDVLRGGRGKAWHARISSQPSTLQQLRLNVSFLDKQLLRTPSQPAPIAEPTIAIHRLGTHASPPR
jgi:hypothetical protein